MRFRTSVIAHPIITAILVLAFVGVAAAAVPVFRATEAPGFCTSCHEMQPYYDAWSVGVHKVTAAKELYDHFATDPLHKPLVSWRRAAFSHPRNTDDHTYRSFARVKCHPSGYSSHSCTCHGGKSPTGD